MNHKIDTKFYPGWTRKSITFSIDDGNVPMDRKFIEIEENVATIRVPGEFEDELQLLYNGKYMTHTLENSVIKLKFLKPGYYHVNVENKDYVFLCGKNIAFFSFY